MIELLENIVGFAFDIVGFALNLAFGAVKFMFGLLGGLFSLAFSLVWFLLLVCGGVYLIKLLRNRGHKQHASHVYEVPDEDFVSFYDQEEAAPFTRDE